MFREGEDFNARDLAESKELGVISVFEGVAIVYDETSRGEGGSVSSSLSETSWSDGILMESKQVLHNPWDNAFTSRQ